MNKELIKEILNSNLECWGLVPVWRYHNGIPFCSGHIQSDYLEPDREVMFCVGHNPGRAFELTFHIMTDLEEYHLYRYNEMAGYDNNELQWKYIRQLFGDEIKEIKGRVLQATHEGKAHYQYD